LSGLFFLPYFEKEKYYYNLFFTLNKCIEFYPCALLLQIKLGGYNKAILMKFSIHPLSKEQKPKILDEPIK